MKSNSPRAAVKVASITVCALCVFSQTSFAQNDDRIPAIPVGWLTANQTAVRTGTKSVLTWEISYPSVVEDFIEIVPPSTVNPTDEVDVEVRVLGNGVTASANRGASFTFVDAQGFVSFDGGSYSEIFFGDNNDVNPSEVVWSRENVEAGQAIRFGGRFFFNSRFGPFYNSQDGTENIRTLISGDLPPEGVEANAPSLEDFIAPYLGADGRVDIGPMDVIVFMELTTTDQSSNGYDLQDLVFLVSFTSNNPKNDNESGDEDFDSSSNGSFLEYDSDKDS